ncbi:DNA repair and recombination protein PIF1 [Trichonephila clavipes]|nr:DNA repair and recombination protein PIF1 [Trichonephila clavipes]
MLLRHSLVPELSIQIDSIKGAIQKNYISSIVCLDKQAFVSQEVNKIVMTTKPFSQTVCMSPFTQCLGQSNNPTYVNPDMYRGIGVLLMSRHYTFKMFRFQICLAFAMNINKPQGQTISICSLDLENPCFSHEQLCVVCSLVRKPSNLFVLAKDSQASAFNLFHGGDQSRHSTALSEGHLPIFLRSWLGNFYNACFCREERSTNKQRASNREELLKVTMRDWAVHRR